MYNNLTFNNQLIYFTKEFAIKLASLRQEEVYGAYTEISGDLQLTKEVLEEKFKKGELNAYIGKYVSLKNSSVIVYLDDKYQMSELLGFGCKLALLGALQATSALMVSINSLKNEQNPLSSSTGDTLHRGSTFGNLIINMSQNTELEFENYFFNSTDAQIPFRITKAAEKQITILDQDETLTTILCPVGIMRLQTYNHTCVRYNIIQNTITGEIDIAGFYRLVKPVWQNLITYDASTNEFSSYNSTDKADYDYNRSEGIGILGHHTADPSSAPADTVFKRKVESKVELKRSAKPNLEIELIKDCNQYGPNRHSLLVIKEIS